MRGGCIMSVLRPSAKPSGPLVSELRALTERTTKKKKTTLRKLFSTFFLFRWYLAHRPGHLMSNIQPVQEKVAVQSSFSYDLLNIRGIAIRRF